MLRDLAVLMMLGIMASSPLAFRDHSAEPEEIISLSAYAENVNKTGQQTHSDQLVSVVRQLCPAIIEAVEPMNNIYTKEMKSACGLLHTDASSQKTDLLALVM